MVVAGKHSPELVPIPGRVSVRQGQGAAQHVISVCGAAGGIVHGTPRGGHILPVAAGLAVLPAGQAGLLVRRGNGNKKCLSGLVGDFVLHRLCGKAAQIQRGGFVIVPKPLGYIGADCAVLGNFAAVRAVNPGCKHACLCVGVIDTRQVADYILAVAVDGAAVNLAALHICGAVTAQDFDHIPGIAGLGAEQVIQVTQHAGHTGGAGHVGVKYVGGALGRVGAQVPAGGAVCAGVGQQRRALAVQGYLVHVTVPVAGKPGNGGPVLRQGDILGQHIAAVQRVPVAAAAAQGICYGIKVCAGNTPHKVHGFLTGLVGRTDLTLLALADIHNRVDEHSTFLRGCCVSRQVSDLVHKVVAVTRKIKVVGACLVVDRPV